MYIIYPKLHDDDLTERLAARDYTYPPSFYHRSLHLHCPRIEPSKCKARPYSHLRTDAPDYLEPANV
jgi:hypothetical protein